MTAISHYPRTYGSVEVPLYCIVFHDAFNLFVTL
jgi:hypothetical protein